jgi:hypothetical protein
MPSARRWMPTQVPLPALALVQWRPPSVVRITPFS